MVPCKFVDLDSDEDNTGEHKGQPIVANNKPQFLQKNDTILLDNYWLNEIKSQEDTARQITTICILLLVASFTIITNNSENIFVYLNDTRPYVPGTSSYGLVSNIIPENYISLAESISFLIQIVSISGFFLIWLLALNAARKALELELIASNGEPHSRILANIAKIKQTHCRKAVNITILGMAFLSIFVSGFVIATLNGKGWLQLGAFIMSISMLCVLVLSIKIYMNVRILPPISRY